MNHKNGHILLPGYVAGKAIHRCIHCDCVVVEYDHPMVGDGFYTAGNVIFMSPLMDLANVSLPTCRSASEQNRSSDP